MLQLTFRDNYVYIPKQAYHGQGGAMTAVGMTVNLAENNVYETDLEGHRDLEGHGNFFEVQYRPGTPKPPELGVLVRNERFISAGDCTGFRPGDNTLHDNKFPYSKGVSAVGTDLALIGSGGGQLTVDLVVDLPDGILPLGDLAYAVVKTIGVLPEDRTLTFPAPIRDTDSLHRDTNSYQRTVRNQCTGVPGVTGTVIVSTGAGSTVPLEPGQSASLIFDSSGVVLTVTKVA